MNILDRMTPLGTVRSVLGLAGKILLGVAVVALVAFVAIRVIRGESRPQQEAAVNSTSSTAVQEGTANTVERAGDTVREVRTEHQRTDTITRETREVLVKIPGGSNAGSVEFDRAFDERIRMRDAYRGEPAGNTL